MPMTLAICARENFAGVAAGAECAVDDETAVADVEKFNGLADEHGNVTGCAFGSRRDGALARHFRTSRPDERVQSG